MLNELKGPLALLLVAVGVMLLGYLLFAVSGVQEHDRSDSALMKEFVPEPPSAEVIAMLEKSRGFEVVVAYEDTGFWPSEVLLERGQSVRFTNNSSANLWVASDGSAENPEYPGLSDCGSSFFDTCRALAPREFWEFTFEKAGTWAFHNNLDKGKSGVVRVEVR